MAKRLHAEIEIDASRERVWALLADTASYPRWNPFVRKFRGPLREGARVKVWLRLYSRWLLPFSPVLTRVEPGREIRWLARTGPRGTFDVRRRFVIHDRDGGGVRFEQGEVCTGFLTPVMFAFGLEKRILRGYRSMNRALKKRAEATAPAD